MSAQRYLVIRFSAIGDCVMAAHVPTAIRLREPEAHIIWAVEQRCAAVIDTTRLVDRRMEAPREKWKKHRWTPSVWREQLHFYGSLRREKLDFGIDLQGHSKTAMLLYLSKPKRRIAAAATDALAARLNPVASVDRRSMHQVEWNLGVLRELGEYPTPDRPWMPPVEGASDPKLVTLSTGAGAKDKQYPLDRWEWVASELMRRGLGVTFLGGPADPRPSEGLGLDLVGQISLAESMNHVARSAVHLAGDTGSSHMAAAYGMPVVSVFGPTNPLRYRPYSERAIVLKRGKETSEVPKEEVLEAALKLLEGLDGTLPH